jgi:hypothetical protein
MGARHRLPEPLGDRIRVEPYRMSLRTQYAPPEWRAMANDYYAAARAWRVELQGYDRPNEARTVSFASWKRLREGKPQAFEAYDQARKRALDTPTDNAGDLAHKIQIAAEILGVADPWTVDRPWAEDIPPGGWTLADKVFAALWRDARAVCKRMDADRQKLRKKGKR